MRKSKRFIDVGCWLRIWVFIGIIWSTTDARGEDTKQLMAKVPRVSASQAYSIYKSGRAVMIDTMAAHNFRKSHILGSINLPYDGRKDLERIKNMRLPFPKEQLILVYCK